MRMSVLFRIHCSWCAINIMELRYLEVLFIFKVNIYLSGHILICLQIKPHTN